jgi:ribosomal protein S18 acetylase RimI-like enzyme
MQLEPASAFTPDALAEVWRGAYEGYYVPLAFDADQLMRHVRWSGIDLDLSVVGLTEGEPFGLSLAARGGDRAWIGGFGITPGCRRRGLATRLMRAHAERLDAAGLQSTRLEVIDVNPAAEVYRRAGFAETRILDVWAGELPPEGVSGEVIDAAVLSQAHARLHPVEPSWRRGLRRLQRILADQPEARVLAVRRGGAVAAFAMILNQPDRFGLFDAAAEDRDAARALIAALAAERPSAQVRLVDERQGSPLAAALAEAGFGVVMRQFEMERARP